MPTYEYECTECGAVVEIFHSITEPARRRLRKTDPKPCDCGAGVQRRIGTGAGVIFKGSGFYETDYRSDSYKNAVKAEKDADSKKPGTSDKADDPVKSTTSDASEPKATSKKPAKPDRKKRSSS